MSERMTVAEVVRELRAYAWMCDQSMGDREVSHEAYEAARARRDALTEAADLVERHLATEVLDEPDGDGDYWIEGREGVHQVEWSTVKQMWCRRVSGWREPIEKARVAKVPPGPF